VDGDESEQKRGRGYRTLNGELATTFRTWYPTFTLDDHAIPVEELPAAA
jgi:hypothetical protein